MRRVAVKAVLSLAIVSSACHEELGVRPGPAKERVEVAELEFEGVQAVDEDRLRAAMEIQESSWLPWGENAYFDRATLDADLKRIQAFYEDQGYPNARIAETDVRLDEEDDAVRISIVVSEGEPVRVAAVAFAGFDPLGAEGVQELRERLPLQPGDPVARHALLQTDEIATAALQNLGYAYAQVDVSTEPLAPDRLRIVARASPGTLTYFGPVEIAGNASVDDGVIRRYLSYRPGDMFQGRLVQESQRRLYGLGLFQFANIEVLDPRADTSEVRTRVTVAERDHRLVEFSVGYGTEEKLRGEAEWRHVNFFGGARNASVHGRMSWLERGLEGRFVQPYLFRPGLSLTLRGHAWYADEPAYRVLSRGGRAIVGYERGPSLAASVTYVHEFESSRVANEALLDPELRDDLISLGLNPTTGEQDGVVSAVMFDVTRQTIDSVLDPKRGYVASFRIEQAGGWLPGTFNYTNTVVEGRAYRTVGDITLAGRARYGAIAPMGPDSDVPFFKRYFLGGADSLRGWGRYQVSPLSGFGLPIGGHTFLEASGEVRVPVTNTIGAVAFVDAGNVWADDWEVRPHDLLYDAGIGVRYDTPIGPLRFDAAYQLTPLEGLRVDGELQDRRWRLHFSIGQAF